MTAITPHVRAPFARTETKAPRRQRFLWLTLWLLLQGTAFAQRQNCNDTLQDDIGQEWPSSMWSPPTYTLWNEAEFPGASEPTREALCTRIGAVVRRGASEQSGLRCSVGCVPPRPWRDGPYHYCESPNSAYSQYYRHIYVTVKHRCHETQAVLSGPSRIPNHLKGVEQGIPLTLQLSEQARYFDARYFRIDPARITVSSDRGGADNRLSSQPNEYLVLPPSGSGGYLVDDNAAFTFRLLPAQLLLSRPVKQQTLTVSATCLACQNTATWDIRVGPPEIVIGFFNGVANTRAAAQDSLDRLKEEFGSQHRNSPIKYDWFYNQTACGRGAAGKLSCLEDVAETFEQRSRELGDVFATRWETFWDILAGRHRQDSSITGQLVGLLGSAGSALLQGLDATANAVMNQLMASTLQLLTLFNDSPTGENQAEHLRRLMRHADDGISLLLVAHSQGNLFVNSAYDALRAARPDATVGVVHVAPASATLRGDYVLADMDLVLNALRLSGFNSVPPVNLTMAPSTRDATGHGFEPSYLDAARAAYARTRGLIVQSLDTLTN